MERGIYAIRPWISGHEIIDLNRYAFGSNGMVADAVEEVREGGKQLLEGARRELAR
jgi:hypothetical protein